MRPQGLLLLAIVALLALLYWAMNPATAVFAPKCLFKMVTGLSCPGCGAQRFLHAALHGRLMEAASYNYMLVVFIPYMLLFGIEKLVLTGAAQQRLQAIVEGKAATTLCCFVAVGWFVLRNILNL